MDFSHVAAISLASIGAIVSIGVVATSDDTNATVVNVIDGGTVVVAHDDGRGEVVRLLNVDTPEHDECGWSEATDYLRGRLTGQLVELQLDTDAHDRYDRLLAGVFLGEELVNASIAGEGLGRPMLIQPNDRFYPQVAAAWTGPPAVLEGTGRAKESGTDQADSYDLYDLTADTDLDWTWGTPPNGPGVTTKDARSADLEDRIGALTPADQCSLRAVSDSFDDPYDASAKYFTHEDEVKAQLRNVSPPTRHSPARPARPPKRWPHHPAHRMPTTRTSAGPCPQRHPGQHAHPDRGAPRAVSFGRDSRQG